MIQPIAEVPTPQQHPSTAVACRDESARARRDALVAQYRPYVYKVARAVAGRLRSRLDVEDLAGWGMLGLLEAAARFDASRGIRFRSFAHHRIRGAIYDGLAKEFGGGATRVYGATLRRELYCVDAAYFGSHPDDAIDEPGSTSATIGGGSCFECPDELVWRAEVRARLETALGALNPVERFLVEHHYFHGETVQSLAPRLRLSKSWLSRVHAKALVKLRALLLADDVSPDAFL